MAITGNDLLKKRRGSTNEDEKEKEKSSRKVSGEDLLNRRKAYQSADTSGVDQKYIDSFMNDSNAFLTTAEKDHGGLGWGSASSAYESRNKTWQDLNTRADTIGAWLYKNRNTIDPDTYASLTKSLGEIRSGGSSVVDAFKGAADYYSQWDTEDAYNAWYAEEKRKEDEQKAIMSAADFAELTKKGAGEAMTLNKWGMASGGNKIAGYRGEAGMALSAQGMRGGATDPMIAQAREMTENEAAIYNYYYAKYGEDKANEYFDSLKEELTKRVEGTAVGHMKSFADSHPVLASAMSPIITAASAGEYIGDLFSDDKRNTMASANSALRETVSNKVDWEIGNWDAFDFVYSTAMSGADSLVAGQVFGPAGGVVLGLSAAASATNDALDRGLSKDKAFWNGIHAGIFEAVFESASIGNFNALKEVAPAGIKDIAKNIGKSMLVNASEETLTEIANIAYDTISNDDLSNYALKVQGYMEAGMSEAEAKKKAAIEMAGQVVEAGASGALMGFGFGGIGSATGAYNIRKQGANLKASGIENVTALAELGKTYAEGTRANQLGNKVNENSGAYDVGRLLYEVGDSRSEQNIADIASGLQAKGMSPEEATKTAKWLYKAAEGGRYSRSQQKAYETDDRIADVHRDLFTNEENSVYKRNTEYDALYALAQEVTKPKSKAKGKDAPSQAEASAQQAETAPVAENAPAKENAVQSEFEASTDGKTTYNGSEVKVQGIASLKNGEVMVQLDNGEVVSARDVEFGSQEEGLIYEAVADMDIDTANDFLQGFNSMKGAPLATPQSFSDYRLGFNEAQTYGELGIPFEAIARDGQYANALSGGQAQIAYNRGRINGVNKATSAQRVAPGKTATPRKYKGETHASEIKKSRAYKSLSKMQRAGVDGMTAIYKALGIDVYFFESPTDSKGNRRGKNGYFDPSDNSVHIDLYAGNDGRGLILFTGGHELTHYIRVNLPTKFKAFADILFEQYEANGTSVAGLVARKKQKLIDSGRITPEMTNAEANDLAYEEVVADACEAMLGNGEAFAMLSEKVKEKDKGLWNAIKKFFTDLVARIKTAYAQLSPDSIEGQKVAEMLETATELQKMWVDMLVEASEASDLVEVDAGTESVAPMFSERTWTASEYVTAREATIKKIVKALGVDPKVAEKYIDDINSIARLIADDRVRLDYEPNLDEKATVLKPNSDYKYTVDMSTLCAKRLLFTGTFDAIQRAMPNTVFDSEDIVALREMMQSRKYEVACGICYVESTRREIGRITKEFIDSYKESQKTGKPMTRFNSSGKEVELIKTKDQKETTADPSTDKFFADKGYTPTLADLNTTDIDLVKRDHPLVYEAYLNFMNARGQAKPKLLETRAEYKGEILKSFKSKSAVNSRNSAGGLRLQSFSDFEVPHMIDMMQIVMDMSRVGLKSQAYTKVPAFAEIFGNTGVKINLSLIAKGDGLDANGNLIFDDVEGINHKEAFALRDKYSKNVGTILVGKTDAHIIAAMADPRIDYIIPFHKSSWKESLYDALGLTGYADYTETQHEKAIDKDRKIKDFDPSEYWDYTKSGDENAQIYLEKCREDGRIPKFPQFQSYPGYWKLLIDFKMYDNDGVGSPQEVVKPDFNTEASERILGEYKGGHKSFPVAKDVVEDFVKDYRGRDEDDVKYSDRDEGLSDADKETAKKVISGLKIQAQSAKYGIRSMGTYTEERMDREIRHSSSDTVLDYAKSYITWVDPIDFIYATTTSEQVRQTLKDEAGDLDIERLRKQTQPIHLTVDFETGEIVGHEGRHRMLALQKAGVEKVAVVIDAWNDDRHNTKPIEFMNLEGQNFGRYSKGTGILLHNMLPLSKRYAEEAKKLFSVEAKNGVRYSDRDISPVTEAETKDLEKHFGTTGNFKVAGYLLTNGKLLDFSGKHWGDTTSRSRQVDHRDVGEVLNRGNNGVADMVDMIGSGNVRLMPEVGGINLAVYPNEKQRRVLSAYINYMLATEGQVIIDYDSVGGDTVYSREYGKTATSRQILTDIRNYFNGARQSDLMRFHTMDSDRDPNAVSNRSLLANALESVAQNDIERNKLKEYQGKIALIESEQAKLAETKAKIKELSFATGRRDTEAIKKLQFEANQSANRINTYDRQLLNLEATAALKGVLQREKQLAYKKAEKEGKEALAKYREKAAKTQRELLTRYQESRQKGIEGRKKTEMRHKIKNVVNELNQHLLNGTKEKHVPIELQKAVAEALVAVNMDTVSAEERIAKKRDEMLKAKTPEAIEKLAKEIANIREMGGNMDAKLARLKTAYDSIINSDDPLIANSHDDVISSSIDKVVEVIGDTPLRDMSLYQLEAVYDLYKMVLHSIRTANKAFKAEKGEAISIIANGVIAELVEGKQKSPYSTKAGQAMSEFNWNNQKPVYAFERIGSKNFTKVFNAVRAGEDVWAKDMSEAQAFREEQFKKYKYDSWDFKKRYAFMSTSGVRFELSLDQILSLYAFSKRAQAGDHLKYGGFVFDGLTEVKQKNKAGMTVTYQLKDATAYNLSEETLAEIIEKLTPEQKEFADTMQDYLSTVMGEKGNEVSLELYDIKLFKEKNYFPLKSAPQYLAKAKEQAQGEVKIKNSGFTKETNPKAKNPIVLSSFMDVWAGHVNDMSMYHAFTLPLEDFYRVYNYHTPADENMGTMSVGASLENAHGQAAVHYIDQLLKDINGGARSDPRESTGKALMSNFKKAAVMASMSVVVQQPSAMVRAMSLVNSRYFLGAKPTKQKHKEAWAEVKRYAPVAVIKEMGYFDTGMGQGSVEWLKGEKTFMDKVDDATSKLPALADEITWVAIWNAVKRETVHTHQHLAPNSDAFLKAVGKRFTEVITKTQVYDSTLSRSANMRSKSTFMNMVTSFMAEPTTSINMLQAAIHKGNKKYIARTMGAVYGSVILNSALVSIVYAMRDDDEDETFAEKYLSRFVTETIDGINPLTYLPFVKDIWSVAQGFDVERADMSLITDMFDSFQQMVTVINKDTSDMDDDELAEHKKAVAGSILGIVDSFSSLAGVPVKNIRREINGVINTIKTFGRGDKTTAGSLGDNLLEDVKDSVPVWGWLPDETKGDKLFDAISKGDTDYIDRLKSGYKSEDSYHSAVKKVVRKHLEDGDISATEAERIIVSHGGVTEEEAPTKVQYWEFKMDYPDYDLSEDAVTKYYSDVEPSGIGIEVYFDYYKQKAQCKGTDDDGDGHADSGTKKAEILEVIDSLPISDEQKDALYFLNGWSANTLWQAPWH